VTPSPGRRWSKNVVASAAERWMQPFDDVVRLPSWKAIPPLAK
jgi:hypothetical protein